MSTVAPDIVPEVPSGLVRAAGAVTLAVLGSLTCALEPESLGLVGGFGLGLALVELLRALRSRRFALLFVLTGLTGVIFVGWAMEIVEYRAFTGDLSEDVFAPGARARATGWLLFLCGAISLVSRTSLTSGNTPRGRSLLGMSLAIRRLATWHGAAVLLVSTGLMVLTSRPTTVLADVYAEAGGGGWLLDSSGLNNLALQGMIVGWGLLVLKSGRLAVVTSTLWVVGFVVVFQLLRGERITTIPVLMAGVVLLLWHMPGGRSWRGDVLAVAVGLGGIVVLQAWQIVRIDAARMGLAAAFGEGISERVVGLVRDGPVPDPARVSLLRHPYWQLLYTQDLVQDGRGLSGATLIATPVQFLPSPILGAFGLERPPPAAERLRSLRPSGGGMFLPAEWHWNLGLPGLVLFALVTGVAVRFLDRLVAGTTSGAYLAYLPVIGFIPEAMFFGMQAAMRVTTNVVLLLGVLWLTSKVRLPALVRSVNFDDG